MQESIRQARQTIDTLPPAAWAALGCMAVIVLYAVWRIARKIAIIGFWLIYTAIGAAVACGVALGSGHPISPVVALAPGVAFASVVIAVQRRVLKIAATIALAAGGYWLLMSSGKVGAMPQIPMNAKGLEKAVDSLKKHLDVKPPAKPHQ